MPPAVKRRLVTLAAILVVVLILLGAVQMVRKTIHASLGYTVESRFAQLPADDSQLQAWIRSQPGIAAHTVSVDRVDHEGKTVRVFFIQSRALSGDPPLPDLDGACNRFGYLSPVYKFRDSNVP